MNTNILMLLLGMVFGAIGYHIIRLGYQDSLKQAKKKK